MGKGYRQGRLGEEIRKIISEMLLRELKDPRLADRMISVTGVDVSADNSYATAYLSVFTDSDSEQAAAEQEVMTAMDRCRGVIRRRIGREIKLRHVPELTFKLDTSLAYGRHIDELLERVRQEDEAKEKSSDESSSEEE
ncbi:MAG: 30S ribosome-binding factor RbfA [Anaerovoracaceae bacterium]|jgi:ribosome-binding factor A